MRYFLYSIYDLKYEHNFENVSLLTCIPGKMAIDYVEFHPGQKYREDLKLLVN